MKEKLSYLIMSIVIFNVLFVFYYYFKIVSFLYVDLFHLGAMANFFVVNLGVLLIDLICILFYEYILKFKLSYFKSLFVGIMIGLLVSFFLFSFGKYAIEDYLAVISYFAINTVFIFYSLYFNEVKNDVFA